MQRAAIRIFCEMQCCIRKVEFSPVMVFSTSVLSGGLQGGSGLFRVFRVIKWCDSDPAPGLFQGSRALHPQPPSTPHLCRILRFRATHC
jgi:hypothetical protein